MNNAEIGTIRIKWIDSFRGIAMILVVFGHIVGSKNMLGRFVYLFHVPAFFFLSGYLFRENMEPKRFFYSRAKRLIIPFFLFTFSIIFYNYLIHIISHSDYDLFWQIRCTLLQIRGQENRTWFLPCLFVAETVFFLIIKSKKGMWIFVILVFLSWINILVFKLNIPWYPDTAIIGSSFMLIGYYARKGDILKKISEVYLFIASLIVCVLILIINIRFSFVIDMVNNKYGNPIIFYIGALAGISLLYSVSSLAHPKILVYIGQNTITFLCLNTISIKATIKILSFIPKINRVRYIYITLVLSVSLSILCVLSCLINKFLPVYTGKALHPKKRNC